MFDLKRKFVKIRKIKYGTPVPEEVIEAIACESNDPRCLACGLLLKKTTLLICAECLDIGCEKFEKEATKDE